MAAPFFSRRKSPRQAGVGGEKASRDGDKAPSPTPTAEDSRSHKQPSERHSMSAPRPFNATLVTKLSNKLGNSMGTLAETAMEKRGS